MLIDSRSYPFLARQVRNMKSEITISPKWTLIKQDLTPIAKGAAIAGLGAFLTYFLQGLMGIDFGTYTPVIVAILSILVNIVRKLVAENKY